MKLDSVVKYFSPKGMHITDTVKETTTDRITGTDMMAALGMAEAKASFGMAAFLGKVGISDEDRQRAIEELTRYAIAKAPKLVGKVAGRRMVRCMQIMASQAFEEYASSAASAVNCEHCNGKGLVTVWRDVVKYPGYVGHDGKEKIPPNIERQLVRETCKPCKGKGVIYKRCRDCKGRGRVVARESVENGAPVVKDCERCGGKGHSRTPAAAAHRAVQALLPELSQSSWSRNWKPLYELLVSKCDIEEGVADGEFQRITRG